MLYNPLYHTTFFASTLMCRLLKIAQAYEATRIYFVPDNTSLI